MAAPESAWGYAVGAVAVDAATIVLPLVVVALVAGLLVGAIQVRGVFSFEPLKPKFERIDPGKGLAKLFAPRQWFELVKLTIKTTLLVAVLWIGVRTSLPDVLRMGAAPPADLLRIAGVVVALLFGGAALVYAVSAAVDYAHQHVQFVREQRMTTDELRRESRENEGDPWLKSYRRSTARELAMSEMLARTADASVVLVNPTHVSVALYFRSGKTGLPRVVAKGVDALALRIRREAERAGVPVYEDIPLARRVFSEVPVDHFIPEGLIDPVAAAFRYARREDRRGRTDA